MHPGSIYMSKVRVAKFSKSHHSATLKRGPLSLHSVLCFAQSLVCHNSIGSICVWQSDLTQAFGLRPKPHAGFLLEAFLLRV